MPLATPGQYAQILDAAERRYAYAAVNVTSSETLNAALRGFQLADADGIIQITVGAGEYMSGTGANDALLGARALARYAHVVAEASPVLIALHTDHCPPAHVDDWLHPLLAESGRRVALGATPLFHSHMFDGSTLPLDGNLRIASALLKKCSELDIVLRRGRRRGRRDRGGPRTGATSSTRQPASHLRRSLQRHAVPAQVVDEVLRAEDGAASNLLGAPRVRGGPARHPALCRVREALLLL